LTFLARALATALGAGYSPVAPGTCGTLVAVPMVWALAGLDWPVFAALTVAVILVGIWAAQVADDCWGTHDSGRIVIDEVAGYMVTMLLIDRSDWLALWVGFAVFRFFDISKPPPVRLIDQQAPGGAGVILDDVAAGVYGALVMIGGSYLGWWSAVWP
jgi:phosphatidylglycerophosphatase A